MVIESSNNQEMDYKKPRQYRSNQGRSPQQQQSNYVAAAISFLQAHDYIDCFIFNDNKLIC